MTKVAIVGGSIAGCAAAIAARRVGFDVTVFERSSGEFRDRGHGIGMLNPSYEALAEAGYVDRALPTHEITERRWVGPDGRELWRQPFHVQACNWGGLWRTLRAQVPDEVYRDGVTVAGAAPDGTLTINGREERFDLIVGADGYRSAVRAATFEDLRPQYAGYVLWRGTYDVARAPMELPDGVAWTAGFDGGHAVIYRIPGFESGPSLVNWGLYFALAGGDSATIPPGAVPRELRDLLHEILDTRLPTDLAELIRATRDEELLVQPIYDITVPSYVRGRVLLAGDAGTIARPHTAAGATKAMEDAMAFEAGSRLPTLAETLSEYDATRCAMGNVMVRLGRRFGRAQVEETPDWSTMDPDRMADWWAAQLSG